MCGITGIINLNTSRPISSKELESMTQKIHHRGPEASNLYLEHRVGMGFARLSIIDLKYGMQPNKSGTGEIISICNGEIYNHDEHRTNLQKSLLIEFHSSVDTEVIPHLYEIHGPEFVNHLNGQFAIALYDKTKDIFFLYRDHFGIQPLYYTIQSNRLIFGSEIKAILQADDITPAFDIVGLDQILSFPGLISPRTMFNNIQSVKPGEYIKIDLHNIKITRHIYWDFNYKNKKDKLKLTERDYVDALDFHLQKAVKYRLTADVPISFYLSGGIDSSLLLSMARQLINNHKLCSFSVVFPDDKLIDECKYQEIMANYVGSTHSYLEFNYTDILTKLSDVIYHTECPIKESFNTAAIMLSKYVNEQGFKVIIGGQGADELFGGYPSYKFDEIRSEYDFTESKAEKEIRKCVWGNENYFYEKKHSEFINEKIKLYSDHIKQNYNQYNCLNYELIDKNQINSIDMLKRRSYLDFKLRLADHLLSDHGDKMLMANSIEGRYPFLDQELVTFSASIPSNLKIKNLVEKYIIKEVSKKYVPSKIINREKFGFTAPGSPYILKRNSEFINDLLSYSRIKRQGIFDPDYVEKLKKQYLMPGFRINVPFDDDYLMIVITTGIFLDTFNMKGI